MKATDAEGLLNVCGNPSPLWDVDDIVRRLRWQRDEGLGGDQRQAILLTRRADGLIGEHLETTTAEALLIFEAQLGQRDAIRHNEAATQEMVDGGKTSAAR